jgi:hypothetical protein
VSRVDQGPKKDLDAAGCSMLDGVREGDTKIGELRRDRLVIAVIVKVYQVDGGKRIIVIDVLLGFLLKGERIEGQGTRDCE